MSHLCSTWAWHKVRIADRLKIVLLSLADLANDDGIAWPSYRYIAAKCGCSISSAKRRIKELKLLGIIEVRNHRESRTKQNNVYRLEINQEFDYLPTSVSLTPPAKPNELGAELAQLFANDSQKSNSLHTVEPGGRLDQLAGELGHQADKDPSHSGVKVTPVAERHQGSSTSGPQVVAPVTPNTLLPVRTPNNKQPKLEIINSTYALDLRWQPPGYIYALLTKEKLAPGITDEFIDAQIIDFILYWLDRGEATAGDWAGRFRRHVINRYQANKGQPQALAPDFMPEGEYVAALLEQFTREEIDEELERFKLYWLARNEKKLNWQYEFYKRLMTK